MKKTLQILLGDASKYYKKHVALKKWINNEPEDVISFGEDPLKVIKEAKDKGYENPILLYIPDPNIIYIF